MVRSDAAPTSGSAARAYDIDSPKNVAGELSSVQEPKEHLAGARIVGTAPSKE